MSEQQVFGRDSSGRPRGNGYTMVPHWVWTLDVPCGAKVLLCWLHSHSDAFLARVTMNGCREAVGSSSITAWFDHLEMLGLVAVHRDVNGRRARNRLCMEAWQSTTEPRRFRIGSDDNRAEIGSATAPKSERIEEQVEEQEENAVAIAPTGEPTVAQRANEVSRGYFDWYVERHGTKPILNFNAIRGLVAKALKAGHSNAAVKIALVAMHDAGTPLSAESLDRQLTRPRPGQPTAKRGWREDDEFTYDGANNPVRYPEHEYKRPRT